jgi:hypothetical protein
VESILEGKQPLTDGYSGLRVVEALEAAQQSLEANGQLVEVESLSASKFTVNHNNHGVAAYA